MENQNNKGVLRAAFVIDAGAFLPQVKAYAKTKKLPTDFSCIETTTRLWIHFKNYSIINN
jgi:hypothetical protein